MSIDLPRDIEEGPPAVRATYIRGHQDGYRKAHEERTTGIVDLNPEANILGRLSACESSLRALTGDLADKAKLLEDLRVGLKQHVDAGE